MSQIKPPSRPRAVSIALKILYITVAISVLRIPFNFDIIAEQTKATGVSLWFVLPLIISVWLIILFIYYKIAKGRNWARITLLVSFIFGLPLSIKPLIIEFSSLGSLYILSSVLMIVVQIIALVLLFQKDASSWFKAMKGYISEQKTQKQNAIRKKPKTSIWKKVKVGLIIFFLLILSATIVLPYLKISEPFIHYLYTAPITGYDFDKAKALSRIQLLSSLKLNINAKESWGEDENSPLFSAIYENDVDVVALMIEKGADVNFKGRSNTTPLHEAANREKLDVAQLLLKHGAIINAESDYGTPLHFAGSRCNTEMVKFLLEAGADSSIANHEGKTLIHLACEDTISFLIKKGFDINLKSENGNTPLHYATGLTEYLLQNGALINAQNAIGNTALHISDVENTKILIASGADISIKNKQGQTAFFNAVKSEGYTPDIPRIKQYLALGIDINAQDNDGNTALHTTLSSSCYEDEPVTFLLNNKADMTIKNHLGKTSFHIFSESEKCVGYLSEKIAIQMIKLGANIHSKDNSGVSPYETLIIRCKDEIFSIEYTLSAILEYTTNSPEEALIKAKEIGCVGLLNYMQ